MHVSSLAGPTPQGEVRSPSYISPSTRANTSRTCIAEGVRRGTECIEGSRIAETVREATLHYAADLVLIGQGRMHPARSFEFGSAKTRGAARQPLTRYPSSVASGSRAAEGRVTAPAAGRKDEDIASTATIKLATMTGTA